MDNRLVWIDLEMTGLDPSIDTILEIATIITDNDLNIIAQGPSLIIHHTKAQLDAMNDFCKTLHGNSGLTQSALESSISLAQAEKQTYDFIAQHCAPQTSPLCGNSIWSDRIYLQKYMPKLLQFLHYRLIDVSSIKELVERWEGEKKLFKKANTHRALDDIKESINELKFYREHYFCSKHS
jgi:oligoribonuclease